MKHRQQTIVVWTVAMIALIAGWATAQDFLKSKTFDAQEVSFCIVGDSNSSWGTPQFYYTWWQYIDTIEDNWSFNTVAKGGARAVEDGVTQIEQALLYNPDYILVSMGTNDIGKYTVEEILQAYSDMERAALGVPVVFVGPIELQPWDMYPDVSDLNEKIAQLQIGIPMVNVLSQKHYLLPIDGIHVDGQGSFDWGMYVRQELKTKYL